MNNVVFWTDSPELRNYSSPKQMSFSVRKTFNRCPRQYYYSNVQYPEFVTYRLLFGTIFHKAVDRIIEMSIEEGCETAGDFQQVLIKENLTIPEILNQEKDLQFERYKENPRFERQRSKIELQIENRMAYLQKKVRERCTDLYQSSYFSNLDITSNRSNAGRSSSSRIKKFKNGSYSEEYLKSDLLGDIGIVDQLRITDDGVEIIDLKTGKPRPEDEEQLYFYQILWVDDERNENRPVKNLIVEYTNNETKKISPLTNEEINKKREVYIDERKKLESFLNKDDFKPIISEECKYCFCRQMCEDYWENLKKQECTQGYEDLQVAVEQDYQTRKTAKTDRCNLTGDSSIKIIFHSISDPYVNFLKSGNKYRILNATVEEDEEGEKFLRINQFSEIFHQNHYSR